MSGVCTRLLPKTNIPFGNLAGGQSQTLIVCAHADFAAFRQLVLLFRFHAATNIGAAANVAFSVLAEGFTLDEPTSNSTTIFNPQPPTAPNQAVDSSFTFVGPLSGPFMEVVSLPVGGATPFGRAVQVQIQATQPATPVALFLDLSIDAVARAGASSDAREAPASLRGHRLI